MARPKVFVTRVIPDEGLQMVRNFAEAEVWDDELPPSRDVLLNKVHGVDGLLCLLTDRIDREVLETAGDSLKVISQMAVGFDNIDLTAANVRQIPVGNTPGVLTDTTADFAFALLMTSARRVVEGERYVKKGRWKTWGPTLLMGHDIHQATLGILGFGRIGKAVAKRARGFDMRVLYYDPHADKAEAHALGAESRSLDEVLAEADFLTIHVPLTPETFHMIGPRELAQMKTTSVLINTSRGSTVDPRALYHALNAGDIAYAALDVTEPEPISMNDPLLTLENCIIVPHIASSSITTRNKMATMAAANLAAGLRGEPLPHCVNPEVYLS